MDFFDARPDLDGDPPQSEPQKAFIASDGARIEAANIKYWNKAKGPDHWTELSMLDRADRLGADVQALVRIGYDMRNFAAHTGLAGHARLDKESFTTLCFFSLKNIGDSVLETLKVLGKEFRLYAAIGNYAEAMEHLSEVPAFALVDKRLQQLGEPQRYFIHPKRSNA